MNALTLLRPFFSYLPSFDIRPRVYHYLVYQSFSLTLGFSLVNNLRNYVNSEQVQMPNYKAHNDGLWFTPENLIKEKINTETIRNG